MSIDLGDDDIGAKVLDARVDVADLTAVRKVPRFASTCVSSVAIAGRHGSDSDEGAAGTMMFRHAAAKGLAELLM